MRVLLAVDGSLHSEVAATSVAARTWPPGTVVRVIAVAPPFTPPIGGLDARVAMEAIPLLFDEARHWATRAEQLLAPTGLPVEQCVRTGGAGRQIVLEAEEWRADLVVVGSHGRTGLKRFFMGSIAEYVVRHAPCSVEVARGPVAELADHPT